MIYNDLHRGWLTQDTLVGSRTVRTCNLGRPAETVPVAVWPDSSADTSNRAAGRTPRRCTGTVCCRVPPETLKKKKGRGPEVSQRQVESIRNSGSFARKTSVKSTVVRNLPATSTLATRFATRSVHRTLCPTNTWPAGRWCLNCGQPLWHEWPIPWWRIWNIRQGGKRFLFKTSALQRRADVGDTFLIRPGRLNIEDKRSAGPGP